MHELNLSWKYLTLRKPFAPQSERQMPIIPFGASDVCTNLRQGCHSKKLSAGSGNTGPPTAGGVALVMELTDVCH
jgi:hypothetical protein